MSSTRSHSKEIVAAAERLDGICDNFENYDSLDDEAKVNLDKEIELFCETLKKEWENRVDVLANLAARGIDSREQSVHSYFQALGAQVRDEMTHPIMTHPKSAIRSALGVFPTAAQTLEWFETRNRN